MKTARTDILDEGMIEQFRKDVLALTKATESVTSIRDIQRVVSGIRKWRKHFENFTATIAEDLKGRIWRSGLPPGSTYNPNFIDKSDAEGYRNHALKHLWEFQSELNHSPSGMDLTLRDSGGNPWRPFEEEFEHTVQLFMDRGIGGGTRDGAEAQARDYFNRRPYPTREEAEKQLLDKWLDASRKWSRRLRDKARKAWETLTQYARWLNSYRGGGEPVAIVTPEEEVVELSGFRVVFRGFAESTHQDKLGVIQEALARYRRYAAARAPIVLKHTPPIVIEWTFEPTTSSSAAGYYENGKVFITPWVITEDTDAFVKVLAHEVGHHILMMLSRDAMVAWSDFLRGNYQDLDLRAALDRMSQIGADSPLDKKLATADPILYLQLNTLHHSPAYKALDFLSVKDIRAYLDRGGEPIIRVPVHPITGYAAKNSDEAFCEAIGNLVAYGPASVPDPVLGMLRVITGGQVRIAANRVANNPCSYTTISFAWIKADGTVIYIPSGESHNRWAEDYLMDDNQDAAAYQTHLNQASNARNRLYAYEFLLHKLKWVRVTNAFTIQVGEHGASDRAMQSMVNILVNCVVATHNIDVEYDTIIVEGWDRSHSMTIANFIAEFGTRKQSDDMYGKLLARTWNKTAAAPTVTKDALIDVLHQFELEYRWNPTECNLDRGDCINMSTAFRAYLADRGYSATLLNGTGFTGTLGDDANSLWRMLFGEMKERPLPLVHTVVQVGHWVVDLTGWQFGSQYAETVYPVSTFRQRWETMQRGARPSDRVVTMAQGWLRATAPRTAKDRPKYQNKKEVPKTDGSGKTTIYEYGPRQIANRHKDKAERIESLRKSIGDMRAKLKSDLKSKDTKTRLTALGVALVDATYERIGNDQSAENGHYGVTGWTMDHITISKDKKRATFKYVGKSGVDHEKTVDDPDIIAAIDACCSNKKGKDHVLSDGDVRVTADMVNDYLRKFDVTAKDLRGFHANREMQERLRAIRKDGPELPRPRKEKDEILKKEFKEALEATAEAVGHEPATLRKQYLVPWLEDSFIHDGTVIDRLDKTATAHHATKSEAEREDDEASRLVRREPKLKPSRDDSKRERFKVRDSDTEEKDKDLSLNYKDNG